MQSALHLLRFCEAEIFNVEHGETGNRGFGPGYLGSLQEYFLFTNSLLLINKQSREF